MRVALIGDYGKVGGSQTVVEQLASALESKVDLVRCTPEEIQNLADIYHLVRFSDYAAERKVCYTVRNWGKPLVLSPIYWPRALCCRVAKASRGMAAPRVAREAASEHLSDENHMISLLEDCAGILPNSYAELGVLAYMLGGHLPPHRIQWHGVESGFNTCDNVELEPELAEALEDAWLFVGRTEPRKCHLTFMESCAKLHTKGVIIGHANRQDCGLVQCFPPIRDRATLATAMRRAKFFWQVSLFETPGLAAMEAASVGTPILVGNQACEQEYFGGGAFYADPTRPETVVKQMELMMDWADGGKDQAWWTHRLMSTVDQMNSFTWAAAADTCISLYNEVCDD